MAEPHEPDAGQWVATKDGKVIATAATPHAVVRKLERMGRRASGATARWVPADELPVGKGALLRWLRWWEA